MLTKLEEKYFSILKDYFGEAFNIAAKAKFKREKYDEILGGIYDDVLAQSIMDSLHKDLSTLDWETQDFAVKRLGGLKTAYIGSGYGYSRPNPVTSDFLRKTCLYTDSVVLADDIFNALLTHHKDNFPPCVFSGLIHSAINLLTIEDFFASDSEAQMCVLAPPLMWNLERKKLSDMINQLGKNELLSYSSDFFGRKFSSMNALQAFASSIKNCEHFFALARKPKMLTNPMGEQSSLKSLENLRMNFESRYGPSYPSYLTYLHFLGVHNLHISNELYEFGNYQATLATDFKGVWNELFRIVRNDNENILKKQQKTSFTRESLIISSLQQDELKWLGNIPLDKLLELREKGELADLRDFIGRNIKNIENASDEDFIEVGNQVRYNIEMALRKHDSEVKGLNEKYRRIIDLSAVGAVSCVVSGTIGFIASAFQPLALASAVLGSPFLIQTYKEYLGYRDKYKELKTKPVAMLFDAKKSATNKILAKT